MTAAEGEAGGNPESVVATIPDLEVSFEHRGAFTHANDALATVTVRRRMTAGGMTVVADLEREICVREREVDLGLGWAGVLERVR